MAEFLTQLSLPKAVVAKGPWKEAKAQIQIGGRVTVVLGGGLGKWETPLDVKSWNFGSTCALSEVLIISSLSFWATEQRAQKLNMFTLRQPKSTSSDYRGYMIFKDTPHDPRRIHLNHNRLHTTGFLPGKMPICRWHQACRWWFWTF